jgi:hypothetical protein
MSLIIAPSIGVTEDLAFLFGPDIKTDHCLNKFVVIRIFRQCTELLLKHCKEGRRVTWFINVDCDAV